MRPTSSLSSGKGNVAMNVSVSSSSPRQLAQQAHMLRHDIGCPAPAPLYAARCTTVHSQRGDHVLSHAWQRTCSLSGSCRLLHSQHPGSSHSRYMQLVFRRPLQRPSRQPGRSADVKPTRLAATGSSIGGGQSMDDDEEGDTGVTRELEGYEVERFRQMGRHLDLMWNVGKKPQPAPCDCCEGSGSRNCGYCNSTGAMMVGHERFCSLEQGCKPCPICNGTGEVKCSHCQGTGYRAGWLEPGCPVEQ